MSSPVSNAASYFPASFAREEAVCLPELLAPAGDWECARAAVENGADAIYFGLEKFNARMRAHNFTEADLPELMAYLHGRGVKGYVTFNTLVFQNELTDAERYARTMIAAGVDAAIVQDVGICRLIRRLSPDFPIHASTQMTVTSAGGVEFARELGCNLVVLARECSLKEIERIAAGETSAVKENECPSKGIRQTSLPLEVFVHGALCVAYSGQCLTSEALGGRSANRGECAQACRMPYELVSDGQRVDLGNRKYLLSPQDLAGLELLPDLVRAGVTSLKIEGRLKSPEYVANITRIYREALQKIVPGDLELKEPVTRHRYEMEMAFSRGLYTGWFGGINNQELVHGRFGKKRGVFLGAVTAVKREGVVVRLEGPLKPGGGVVFDAGKPEEKEEGGRVYEVRRVKGEGRKRRGLNGLKASKELNGEAMLLFGKGDIDFGRVHVGDKVWKTSDPELDRHLRKSFAGDTPRFQRPITFEVHGAPERVLTVVARDELGHVARKDSAMPLARAERQPFTEQRLVDQLGRLGGTPFKFGGLQSNLQGEVLLPVSELNRLRRELVSELEAQRAKPKRWQLLPQENEQTGAGSERATPQSGNCRAASPEISVLVRNLSQLDAALEEGVRRVYCEFEDLKKYREAVARFRALHENRGAGHADEAPSIWVAPPRVFKMGEEWTLKQVRSSEADGYLARNYDHLRYFGNDRRMGDYSLNVANRLSAEYFRERFGLERLTASYDLNFNQLEALLKATPPEWFEITIHQHMPMFHMEHCVFCAFLSNGTDYTNCGRPCDRHDVKLRDRVGAEHPIKADAGCRNTVFNALAQTGAEYVSALLELGVRAFRLEFLNETPEQVARTIGKYRQLLRGEVTGGQLWRELKLFNQLGVTRGQMGR